MEDARSLDTVVLDQVVGFSFAAYCAVDLFRDELHG